MFDLEVCALGRILLTVFERLCDVAGVSPDMTHMETDTHLEHIETDTPRQTHTETETWQGSHVARVCGLGGGWKKKIKNQKRMQSTCSSSSSFKAIFSGSPF
jgi:hypothetical protein